MTLCNVVHKYQLFGGTCCLYAYFTHLLPSSWRQTVSPEHWCISTKLKGVIYNTVKNSYMTSKELFFNFTYRVLKCVVYE
jgi:hypothetical protein